MPHKPAYFVHEKADRDLEEIFEYSVKQFGLTQAEQYIYDIEQTFKDLALNPRMGRPANFILKHYSQYPVGSHIIFFATSNVGVEIFRILHKNMLANLHL